MSVGELLQRAEYTYNLAKHLDEDLGIFNNNYHWIVGYDAFCILANNTRVVKVSPEEHTLFGLPIFIDHHATMRIELFKKVGLS